MHGFFCPRCKSAKYTSVAFSYTTKFTGAESTYRCLVCNCVFDGRVVQTRLDSEVPPNVSHHAAEHS